MAGRRLGIWLGVGLIALALTACGASDEDRYLQEMAAFHVEWDSLEVFVDPESQLRLLGELVAIEVPREMGGLVATRHDQYVRMHQLRYNAEVMADELSYAATAVLEASGSDEIFSCAYLRSPDFAGDAEQVNEIWGAAYEAGFTDEQIGRVCAMDDLSMKVLIHVRSRAGWRLVDGWMADAVERVEDAE